MSKVMKMRPGKVAAAAVLSTGLVLGGAPAILGGAGEVPGLGVQAAYAAAGVALGSTAQQVASGVYDVNVAGKNASDLSKASMVDRCIDKSASQLVVGEDGTVKLRVVWLPATVGAITAYAEDIEFYDSMNKANSLRAKVIATYANGKPKAVEFAIPKGLKNQDGLLISMVVSGTPMAGRTDAYLAIDYNSLKAAALKKVESEKTAPVKKAVNAVSINSATVSFKALKAAVKKAGGSVQSVTSVTLGAKVKTIKPNTFKRTAVKTVTVKTKKLTKRSVKNALKGSKVSTVKVDLGSKAVNKKYVKTYKKIFTAKIVGKKPTVK